MTTLQEIYAGIALAIVIGVIISYLLNAIIDGSEWEGRRMEVEDEDNK